MGLREEVASNIALLIKASGKSKTQIAQELGLTQAAISKMLSGAFPSLETFKKLCQVLDCNYEDILGRL